MRFFAWVGVVLCACGPKDPVVSDDAPPVDTDLADTDAVDTDAGVDTDPVDTDPVDTDTSVPMWDTDTGSAPSDTGPDPDLDGDGSPASVDCDDQDPEIFPGALERCDGLDNNCDAIVDGAIATFFPVTGAPADFTAVMSGTPGSPGVAVVGAAGELVLCPGTWYTSVRVNADDVTVRAFDEVQYTALDGTGALAETLQVKGDDVTVRGLELLNANGPIARVLSGATGVSIEGTSLVAGTGGAAAGGLNVESSASVRLVAGIVKGNVSTGSGGGIAVGSNATLEIDGTVFESNAADNGAVVAVGAGGVLTLTDVVARNNTAFTRGGVVYVGSRADVTVSHGDFDDNNAGEGGALWIAGSSTTLVVDAFTEIRSSGGGAVVLDAVGSVRFDDVIFDGNNSTADGAAVRAIGATTLVWTRGLVRSNAAGVHGAVRVEGGVVTLDQVQFRGNLAAVGGALSVSAGDVSVLSGTFDGNEATSDGGAVHLQSGTLTVTGGTWSRNVAARGGGLFLDGGTATLDSVDLSTGALDNDPTDIELPGGATYLFGAATSAVCDLTACL